MAAKTICIWGRGGCGKTVLALNLAAYLAQNQMLVGLVSAADYAEIPAYLGMTSFPSDKGMKAAKDNPGDNIKNFYIPVPQAPSLYLLSSPPDCDSLEMSGFDKAFGRRVVQESKDTFDALVIDCSTNKENAITGEAIALSDAVVIPVDDDITYPEWVHSNIRIFDNIKVKTIYVESKYNGYANLQSILRSIGANPVTSLQYIKTAPNSMNDGVFIYKGGREQKIYESGLSAIWEAANGAK